MVGLLGKHRSGLRDSSPQSFVGNIEIARSEQIFQAGIAERETRVQRDGVLDDRKPNLVEARKIVIRQARAFSAVEEIAG
jgi:hypothetical protein